MQKLLILGGTGLVGSFFINLYGADFEIESPSHNDLDLLNQNEIERYLNQTSAEVILNFAAFTNVDAAEDEKDDKEGEVYILNSVVPESLARFSKQTNKHLVHVSTDYVFDGTKEDSPYTEEDTPNPICWYAKTKFFGEQNILSNNPSVTIARIEMPYASNYDRKKDFARFFVEKFSQGENFSAVADQNITPIFVNHCVAAFKVLIEKKPSGIYHVASTDSITPYQFATQIALKANQLKIFKQPFDTSLVRSISFEQFNTGRKASRPRHSWMSTQKFVSEFGEGILHTNEQSIQMFLQVDSKNTVI